ncbi:UDP-forming cellulose synthase catalytic subunit [Paracraurococcus ruber]|nr:UDP-forming cellulose synthase catalytic subunit [Paracraurococcus ruber]
MAAPAAVAAVLLGLLLLSGVLFVPLDAEGQAIFALGSFALFLVVNRIEGRGASAFLVVLSLAVTTRYLHWRLTETLAPETAFQGFFMLGLAAAEIYAGVALFLGYLQTLWPLERKPVPMPPDPAAWPAVDVFIPTYNETLEVVGPTVLAALAMDWPPDRLRVWILDDGRREEMRRFAEECGAGYVTRPDNKGAKAGNINHALGITEAPFVVIFDCDHIPTRGFLQLAMGWLLRDARIGMVQTPHHFYSPDPFERNLTAGHDVPNEGLMFYGLVQPSNDLWNAAFFCGSCAIIRRKALEEVGGVPHETVTEDCHFSLRMQRRGWHTAYLRLPLAAGLATERLIIHIGQRMRWARGMIQIFRIENPLFASGLSLTQRLCYFSATFHFLFAVPRVVFLTSPLAFLLLGQNVIAASPLAIAAYAGSHLVHAIATASRLSGSVRLSFWSEIYETVLAFYLVPLTIVTLLNPRKGKFNVTDKGGLLQEGYYDLRAVWPTMLLALALLVGIGFALRGILVHPVGSLEFQAYLLNGLWATICLVPVIASIAVGRERRQIRQSARARASLPASLLRAGGARCAGRTLDLSMTGAALEITAGEPPGLGEELRLALELGDGPVDITAVVVGVAAGGQVQLRLQPATLAERGAAVRAAFGRADAWVGWADHQPENPLRSLGIAVRAAGAAFAGEIGLSRLFSRRRGRAKPQRSTGASASAAPAPMPRAARVTPPRLTVGLVLALLLGVAPALAQPGRPDAGVRLLPGPGLAVAPSAVAPGPVPASPGMSLPLAPPMAAMPPAGGTRQVTWTFRQLGHQGPLQLRGIAELQGVLFGLRADEVVTAARLVVAGATSPALLPEQSQIAITLNEEFVGAIQPRPDAPRFGPLEFPISPLLFAEFNRLNLRFTGRYAAECNDPFSGLLWANVSDLSALHLTIERLPMPRDLARLPEPFFDRRVVQSALTLPFVLPAEPGPELLRAAAIAASWFAVEADYRGASFPVLAAPPPEGHAVMVVVGNRGLPPGLDLPGFEGPTLALLPNPNDRSGHLLVIGGRNAAEAAQAATALAFGRATLSGERALVEAAEPPPRRPYDAPRWLPTDRPVRFGELLKPEALQANGFAPGPVTVPLRTAPDLYVARGRGIPVELGFRAPPGPVADTRVSRLDVALSGTYLKSLPFRSTVEAWPVGWAMAQLGWPGAVQRGGVELPPYLVSGQNELQLAFDMRPLQRGNCATVPGNIHAGIDPDSTVDLSSAHRVAVLPNLAFFASGGFPYTRMADLSETAVVLPDRPNAVEMTAFLDLVGKLAASTGLPATGLAVVGPGALDQVAERDLIVLGTLGRQPAFTTLLQGEAPVRLEGNRLALAIPTGATRAMLDLFDRTGTAAARQRAAARLAAPPERFGALVALESPLQAGRSVVLVAAAVPAGLDAVLGALRDPALRSQVQGDLVLVSGSGTTARVEAHRTGARYLHGELPLWLWPEFYLGGRPELMLGLLALACLLIGLPLRRALRARAVRRLRARSA